jgi:epsin
VGLAPTLTLLTECQQVREATNNEPWGASSSVMQEIANGTFN